MKKIIPSILTNNFADLEFRLKQIEELTDWVQIDILDGKFTNNMSISIEDIASANISKNLSVEAHLMVENPNQYFERCGASNIKRVIFHIEATDNADKLLDSVSKLKMQRGLALKPETSVDKVYPYINDLDVIVLMAVEPGFQGQKFIDTTLDKIKLLKKMAPNIKIEVDGGINLDNIQSISDAGADYFILGSALLKSDNIKETFEKLNNKIQ
jgi:ribulose-phosphate 3-epimerase